MPDPSTSTTPKELALQLPPKFHPQHRSACATGDDALEIGAVECGNGKTQYKVYCSTCGRKGGPISHSALQDIDLSAVRVIGSHSIHPCERCGSISGSERHHWAPYHLFEDAYRWPTSYLCRECHREWHRRVTPHMTTGTLTREAA